VVASVLALVVSAIVLAGVVATPALIPLIAPGFTGATRELTIQIVRTCREPGCWCFSLGASAC
jgi:putative peptidoglycan lipid II flippase